jgi:MSHA biogenesis protein MshO
MTFRKGFTLIEFVIVIVITGVMAAAIAVFMRAPVQSYFDTTRRADLADQADNALRRIGRDLRLALPNSVRVMTSGTNISVEFLITRSGGRYRSELTGTGTGNILDFSSGTDNSFDVLGPAVQVVAGDQIVIYNLGIDGADAYETSTVRRAFSGAAGNLSNISFTSTGSPFPFSSPDNRFFIIAGSPVSYNCNLTTGLLTRHSGYAISTTQLAPATASGDTIASGATACTFTYDSSLISQRVGLVTLILTLSQSGENVRLYHAIHVNNAP